MTHIHTICGTLHRLADALRLAIVAVVACTLGTADLVAAPTSQPADTNDVAIDDLDLLNMNIETVVTGLRRARSLDDTPYAVSIVTAQDIRDAGCQNIPDALRLIPGVDVSTMLYAHSYVGIRGYFGAQSEQNIILLDGRRIQSPVLGRGDLTIIQIDDIDRIEVVRGPAGGSWGSGATNGMINIVTKDPADQQGLTSVSRGGSRRTYKEYVSYANSDGNFRYRASGTYEQSQGLVTGHGAIKQLDNDYQNTVGSFKGVVEKSPTDTFTFSGGGNNRREEFDLNPLFGFPYDPNGGTQSDFLTGRWHKETDLEHTLDITGAFTDLYESAGSLNTQSRYQEFTLDVCNTLKPANHPDHTIVWGLESRGDYIDTSYSDPYMARRPTIADGTFGLYAEDDWRFAERWSLSTTGRIDYDCRQGFEPSGRVALSYKPDDDSTIYGAISRAFMTPTPTVPFVDIPGYGGLLHMATDPNIRTTHLMTYELGYRRSFLNNKLDTDTAIYWNEYSDAFGTGTLTLGPPGLIRMPVQNVGDCSTYGFEFGAKYRVNPKLTLLGNYTFQQMDWRGTPNFPMAMYLPDLPEHKFMIGQTYAVTRNLRLSSFLYYVTETTGANPNMLPPTVPIDEYFKLDLRAEYSFWNDRATLAVGVQNALDPRHYEVIGAYDTRAEVPRVFYAELRVTFK